MEKMSFSAQPLVVKVVVGLTIFNSWILFEETVIDRQGLWKYLPGYQFGDPCLWDLSVAIIIAGTVWVLGRAPRPRRGPGTTSGAATVG